ncbi:MAG: DNA-formamidopyrimidine glycosylase family protein [candidate division WOR-3 bacterium]
MEGPGVYLIKEKLKFLKGKIPIAVSGNTRENKEIIVGKKLLDVKSFGKRLIFEFDSFYLIIHFLMYGSLRINEKRKNKKERISIKFKNTELNFYNTSVKILKKEDFIYDPKIDIMSRDFDKIKAKEKIKNSDKFICDIILDQNIFAGVGNIIKNEALFMAGIHPLSICKSIEEKLIDKLIDSILSFSYDFYLLRKTNKSLKEKLFIYGKKFCRICNSKIKLKYTGEKKRKSFFCENCQKLFYSIF